MSTYQLLYPDGEGGDDDDGDGYFGYHIKMWKHLKVVSSHLSHPANYHY